MALKAKVPLQNNYEPNLKISGSISALAVLKLEVVSTKKRPQTVESASSPPEPIVPLSQVLEQISLLSQRINMVNTKWEVAHAKVEQQLATVRSNSEQANDRLVQLSLDVQQVLENVVDFDTE